MDHHSRQAWRRTWRERRFGQLRRSVGIDEFHLNGLAVAANEEKLISLRKPMLDERGGEGRQEVPVDGALERPRSHCRREPFFEQEIERRGLPFDRPLAMSKSAPLEHLRQFLGEDASHQLARQRAEHDDRIEPVDEFRAEALVHGAKHVLLRKAACRGREPRTGLLLNL